MRRVHLFTAISMVVLAISGCKKAEQAEPATVETTGPTAPAESAPIATDVTPPAASESQAAAQPPAGTAAGGEGAFVDKDGKPVAVLPFDYASVATSTQPLGGLPIFSMPQGYVALNDSIYAPAYARFPFRLKEGVHWVEGPAWVARIKADDKADKQYSELEVQRNLENALKQAGAVQVYDGPLQRDIYYGQLSDEIGDRFVEGVNLNGDTPTRTWVIHQSERNVWVQIALGDQYSGAGVVAMEERPFVANTHWGAAFPYLAIPAGYKSNGSPKRYDFNMFPFWTGDHFEQVEGKAYAVAVRNEDSEKMSMHEVRRNLEAMVKEAGGSKVFEGRIPKAQAEAIDEKLQATFSDGASFAWGNYDSAVYKVDRADGRQVWIYARLQPRESGWVVVEREGFKQTSGLLPADALKKQLDADGKVALQVNFATDKTEILPDSLPQIDQVVQLLKDDAALKLAINGHTDSTGDKAHNQSLSEGRAKAVVAAITAKGIDGSRLSAAGFGDTQPVADNGSEDGKAKNRRVELVKQ